MLKPESEGREKSARRRSPRSANPVPASAKKPISPSRSRKSPAGSEEDPLAVFAPTHEEIARRAYEIFLARAGAPGSPEEDWLRAEQELRASETAKTPRRKRVARTREGHA